MLTNERRILAHLADRGGWSSALVLMGFGATAINRAVGLAFTKQD
jgi:hypothetical protein